MITIATSVFLAMSRRALAGHIHTPAGRRFANVTTNIKTLQHGHIPMAAGGRVANITTNITALQHELRACATRLPDAAPENHSLLLSAMFVEYAAYDRANEGVLERLFQAWSTQYPNPSTNTNTNTNTNPNLPPGVVTPRTPRVVLGAGVTLTLLLTLTLTNPN